MIRRLIGLTLAFGLIAQLAPAQSRSAPQAAAAGDSTPSTSDIRAVLDQVQRVEAGLLTRSFFGVGPFVVPQ